MLNAPSYQARFVGELAQGFPRIPFPVEADAFTRLAALGKELLDAHKLPPSQGRAQLVGIPGPIAASPLFEKGRIQVSKAGFVEPVSDRAWMHSVSGYRVIERWLKGRAGLDLSTDWDLVDQLLRVVEAVEASARLGPRLDSALAEVLDGEALGSRALLPIDLREAVTQFARIPGALERAAEEADAWEETSNEALLQAEPN
jgi:hypothetical protein